MNIPSGQLAKSSTPNNTNEYSTTSPQFLQATPPTRTTTTACTACRWAAPGRGRRRRGASAVATLLRHVLSHFHLISTSPVFHNPLRISYSTLLWIYPLRIITCCNSEHCRRAMLTLRDMQLPFTPNRFISLYISPPTKNVLSQKKNYSSLSFLSIRLVNSRQQCTARHCSTEKPPLAAAATTRSPCPAPRATPSPSTTRPPPTLGTSTLIPLQGLLVNLQIHIARPQPPLRGCQPQHLPLHLLVINSLRRPPQR